ncbi:MAG: hypothetical protein LAP40_10940 [Acidobacteriia bacterium]|nr:hypothetical protein [Terriglobia bacterium]
MGTKKAVSAEELLKDPTGEIAELRKMGITDYAIITYVVRVLEGQSKEQALTALLEGRRSLRQEQKEIVRTVLNRLPIPKFAVPSQNQEKET